MAKDHRGLNAELAQEDVLLNDPTSYAGSSRGWFRSCWRRAHDVGKQRVPTRAMPSRGDLTVRKRAR
jgi:hypothetical protein